MQQPLFGDFADTLSHLNVPYGFERVDIPMRADEPPGISAAKWRSPSREIELFYPPSDGRYHFIVTENTKYSSSTRAQEIELNTRGLEILANAARGYHHPI